MRGYLRAVFSGVERLPSIHALQMVWVPTGEAVPYARLDGNGNALQADLLQYVGDLSTFARRAHPDASKLQVLRALRDMVPQAPSAERDERADLESRPVRLVEAILNGPVYFTEDRGESGSVRTKTTPAVRPEKYLADGVAVIGVGPGGKESSKLDDPGVVTYLLVNLDTAINAGVLARDGEFGRSTSVSLARYLKQAPGYRGLCRQGAWRLRRWHQVEIHGPGTGGTGGTDSCEGPYHSKGPLLGE